VQLQVTSMGSVLQIHHLALCRTGRTSWEEESQKKGKWLWQDVALKVLGAGGMLPTTALLVSSILLCTLASLSTFTGSCDRGRIKSSTWFFLN